MHHPAATRVTRVGSIAERRRLDAATGLVEYCRGLTDSDIAAWNLVSDCELSASRGRLRRGAAEARRRGQRAAFRDDVARFELAV
jgi:hypothetical protein